MFVNEDKWTTRMTDRQAEEWWVDSNDHKQVAQSGPKIDQLNVNV